MSLPVLEIEAKGPKRRYRAKTHGFSAKVLGCYHRSGFSSLEPVKGAEMPLFLALLGSEAEVNAVMANLRCGRAGRINGLTVQIPKRAPLRWTNDAATGARIVTAVLPEAFQLDPPDPFPTDLRFISIPPRRWLKAQAQGLAARFGEDALDAARARLFAAYLDRRTALPILDDARFHLRLFRAALEQPWVGWDHGGIGLELCGFDTPLVVKVDREPFAAFLQHQTSQYFDEEVRHGQARIESDCRILPLPGAPAAQLCLDFAVAV